MEQKTISENSRRIAKNAILLYFRMFILLFIGLFTSRVVLKALGVEDFGLYNAVGDVVLGFSFITTSISVAISRFLAHSIGENDLNKAKRVFSSAVFIQLALSLVFIILVETLGRTLLHSQMNIPSERMEAAEWVLQCSLIVLVITLLSLPYNAAIVAHEKMGAFAIISLLEGGLKLLVAILLYFSSFDKVKTYALLMVGVALLTRLAYGLYCRKYFSESRGAPVLDRNLVKEMSSFAGWTFFGASASVLNTRGVNVLVNIFFGVTVNAARGIASQVEGIVRQFVSNMLTAINPQITKSLSSGDRDYCFELVRKGAKYTFYLILLFFTPIAIWTPELLQLWLGQVPEYSVAFVRLILICLLVDMTGNTLITLIQAQGKIRSYYLITGLSSYLCLPAIWISFKLGASPEWAYLCFIAVYLIVFVERLVLANKITGFPIGRYLRGFFCITEGERLIISKFIAKCLRRRE